MVEEVVSMEVILMLDQLVLLEVEEIQEVQDQLELLEVIVLEAVEVVQGLQVVVVVEVEHLEHFDTVYNMVVDMDYNVDMGSYIVAYNMDFASSFQNNLEDFAYIMGFETYFEMDYIVVVVVVDILDYKEQVAHQRDFEEHQLVIIILMDHVLLILHYIML
eukprot:CAMPEP_0201573162 /NCGR_PEP_ID=MMETSP0190_2-20130828/16861_1 /ASSEMBLY_ACC=CAM_ASM_000263 /TAXON_ID=37353 /ORGANISM="Rosalina sp." /LENGTH=160 /DNA_ID=CAMNT_0047999797 /DNA_START=372 /DNA_END=854 /DNA_ORIENTATION=-